MVWFRTTSVANLLRKQKESWHSSQMKKFTALKEANNKQILSSRKKNSKETNKRKGDVAALVMSHMNGLLPFERTIEQTTETMPLALKQ